MNQWIYERIERSLEEGSPTGTEIKDTSELNALRTENVDLKKNLKILTEKIQYYELREERRHEKPSPLTSEIIDLLKSDDTIYWPFAQIVNYIIKKGLLEDDLYEYTEEDITRIVRRVVDDYEKVGLISITGKGCKWIG